ncbi:matrixin family metalloprotease [Chloroflexota bacterium]
MKRPFLAILMAILMLTSFPAVAVLAEVSPEIELMGLEWNHDPLSVNVKVTGSLTNDYVEMVDSVLGDWTTALQGTGEDYEFNITSDTKADIRIVIHPGKYNGVLGLTKPFDRDNDGYFDSVLITMKLDSAVEAEDFRNVLRHEMGHVLGLGHTQVVGDLMYPYYNPATNYDVMPSELDIEALLFIYGNDGFGGENIAPSDIPDCYPN